MYILQVLLFLLMNSYLLATDEYEADHFYPSSASYEDTSSLPSRCLIQILRLRASLLLPNRF